MSVAHDPPWGMPPKTICPIAGDRTVVEFGLTLITVLILLATGHSLETALAVPLLALVGVQAAYAARIFAVVPRGQLTPWQAAGRPVAGPGFA